MGKGFIYWPRPARFWSKRIGYKLSVVIAPKRNFMHNTRRNAATFYLLRAFFVVAILTPCLLFLLPSSAASGTNSFTGTVSVYAQDGVTFTNTGSLNRGRYEHTATLLKNGLVLVTGGNYVSSYLRSAELFDPATGVFTYTGNMNSARAGHTATLLNNGQVLVTGGSGGGGLLASAELYDSATGTWSTTGSMSYARYGHIAISWIQLISATDYPKNTSKGVWK